LSTLISRLLLSLSVGTEPLDKSTEATLPLTTGTRKTFVSVVTSISSTPETPGAVKSYSKAAFTGAKAVKEPSEFNR